ncbi:MAG: DNA mismatch repair protein MutS [Roseiarcus sp.]
MAFHSILSEGVANRMQNETPAPPVFFVDLNLDQIIARITAGKEEYNLAPFFYRSLHDLCAINYRQEISRDLETNDLLIKIKSFAQKLHSMREIRLNCGKLHYKYQREALFIDAVSVYCDAVNCLRRDLTLAEIHSRGLLSFRDYLVNYTESDRFTSLLAETQNLAADLSMMKYTLLIKGSSIKVRRYDSETDYTSEVEQTFRKFQQGAVKDYSVKFSDWAQMNHIEAGVLDRVARLYPETFLYMDAYCVRNAAYLEETIRTFDREIQFYVAYLDYIEPLRRLGFAFCYPALSVDDKELRVCDTFDLALGNKLMTEGRTVVRNDFYLKNDERIFVVSGPNQGGKTTFARMFGQLHFLASLGCLVPGKSAKLFLFDQILTHFEREEDISNLRGKLQDDLVRIQDILSRATSSSIIIMNEIFNSTTLKDAIFLGTKIIERIVKVDALCICVTFIDELTLLSASIVSAASTIVPEHPAARTYKIVRKPADGLAHAMSIAEKHGLTRDQIRERIKS